jgi:hypothetical protein
MSNLSEEVKREIKALYNGSVKKPHNVAKEYPTLYIRARKVFGSWKKALEACGIDYEKARNHKKWSRAKVVEEINRLHLSGDNLRLKDLRRKGMVCLISAAMYHFGSWRRAVESCGICYSFGKEKKMTNNSQVIPHAKKAGNKPRPL